MSPTVAVLTTAPAAGDGMSATVHAAAAPVAA